MKQLVIFSMDTFGDIVLRQSFFKGLLDLDYEITVVVQERFAVLLPFLDIRLKWLITSLNPKAVSLANRAEVESLRAQIAALNPDALVSAEYWYTNLEQWLMLRFPKLSRFGFDNPALASAFKISQPWIYLRYQGKHGAFNRLVSGCQKRDHEFTKTQAMFKAITGQDLSALPQLVLDDKTVQQNKNLLTEISLQPHQYVIAALGGNTNAAIKLLPVETSAKTLIYLYEKYQLPAVLTGIKSEEAHLQKIANFCEAAGIPVFIWLGSTETFGSLLYLIQQAHFYYGSDTGAMHFAGAMNLPVLAHFGGGTWPRFLPLAEKSYVVCQDLPCYGCDWQCWAGTPLCINRVAQEKLYAAVDWILEPSTQGKMIDKGVKLDAAEAEFIQEKAQKFQRKRMIKLGLQAIWRNLSIF